jgi:hypothetical protein
MAALRVSLRVYRVHLAQLETARVEAKAAEDNLAVGSCLVIRDFVNHHDHGGKHVKCLHWVLAWRDVAGEPLKRLKLRHYCSDKKSMNTDSYFQADVMDFHLDEDNSHCPLLFRKFGTIIFVGDHGPHFASHDTMHNESTAERRYNKILIIMFLASYHAYSRADASGSEDSTALRKSLGAGFPVHGATAMKDMTNDSHDGASWAYEMPAINRNADVFPPEKHYEGGKNRAKWIKKWCEIKYSHPDKSSRWDGILQYRLVTGVGDWQWTDMIAKSRDPADRLCDSCSTKANAVVCHEYAACPAPSYIHNLPEYADLQPDPNRIQGPQMRKKSKKQKAITFPCKFNGCDRIGRHAFRKPHIANRHMNIEHTPTDAEYNDLKYPTSVLAKPHVRPSGKGPGRPRQKPVAPVESDHYSTEDNNNDAADERHGAPAGGSEPEEPRPTGAEGESDSERQSDTMPDEDESGPDNDDVNDGAEDPDELVDIDDDQYVVVAVLKHKLQDNGSMTYRVSWEGTATQTWEPSSGISKGLRDEYHADLRIKQAEERAATENRRRACDDAVAAQRGSSRSRRSRPQTRTAAERTAFVENLADQYRRDGTGYHLAYELAETQAVVQGY